MPNRISTAAKRLGLVGLAVGAVTALSGCVVVPAHHGRYGYGYYENSGYVRTPPPPPRYYPYYRYRGY